MVLPVMRNIEQEIAEQSVIQISWYYEKYPLIVCLTDIIINQHKVKKTVYNF